jgi:cytochrome c biogenesis protein CcdA
MTLLVLAYLGGIITIVSPCILPTRDQTVEIAAAHEPGAC